MIDDKIAKIEKIRKAKNTSKWLPGSKTQCISVCTGIFGAIAFGILSSSFWNNYMDNKSYPVNWNPSTHYLESKEYNRDLGFSRLTALSGGILIAIAGMKTGSYLKRKIRKNYKGILDDNSVIAVEYNNNYFVYEELDPSVFKGLENKDIVKKWESWRPYRFSETGETFIVSKEEVFDSDFSGGIRTIVEERKPLSTKKETLNYIKDKYSDKNLYIKNAEGILEHYKNSNCLQTTNKNKN
jgi:uncharacterized protein YjhX (UPF0386 family)